MFLVTILRLQDLCLQFRIAVSRSKAGVDSWGAKGAEVVSGLEGRKRNTPEMDSNGNQLSRLSQRPSLLEVDPAVSQDFASQKRGPQPMRRTNTLALESTSDASDIPPVSYRTRSSPHMAGEC